MTKMKLFVAICLLAFTQNLFAQAPGAINYQAVARDNNGKLITSSQVSLRITVLSGSSSGTAEIRRLLKT